MAPAADPRPGMSPAILAGIERLPGAPGLAVFTVRPDGTEVPSFTPGQHMALAWEHGSETVVRHYSIASAPEQRDRLEFYVVRSDRGGPGTGDLFLMEPGARVWLGPPQGDFTLARTSRRHLALVATGTGIAPYVSMLRHSRAAPGPHPAAVTLWHGVRLPAYLGYRGELEVLQRSAPFPFVYVPTASRLEAASRDAEPTISRGRVDELLAVTLGLGGPRDTARVHLAPAHDPAHLRALLPPGETAVYLCGHPQMIRSFEIAARPSAYHADLVTERFV